MKILLLLVASILALISPALAADKAAKERKGRLQHVVAFKFKEDASRSRIEEVEKAFAELPGKIKVIQHFEWGTNVSPEKLDKGFTHGFILTFKTAADRDAYLVHPDHKAFGNLVGPVLADVFVIDFWAE
jgi:opacity protein-like surface antigen